MAILKAAKAKKTKKEISENKPEIERSFGLSKAKNWYSDRYQMVVVQRNVLFFVTILALLGLILSVLAVAALNNRKTFEPFVIEVEDKTGAISQISASSLQKYKADEVLMRYFIIKYVQARESYTDGDFSRYYNIVKLMSGPGPWATYRNEISSNNEDSPVHLGVNAIRDVGVKSLTVIEPAKNRVQIRIKKSQISAETGSVEWEKHYIITLTYKYLDIDFTEGQRLVNPLGFRVESYRMDRDSGEQDDDKYNK